LIDDWLNEQTPESMRSTLRLLLKGSGQEAERAVRGRFNAWQRVREAPDRDDSSRRTVAQIEARRDAARALRLERERQERELLEARRRAERTKYLARLAERADEALEAIDKTLQRGSGAAYDAALQAVKELSEALSLSGRDAEFRDGLAQLMSKHSKRPSWIGRLIKAGYLHGSE
jgi:hypothetical protein